MAIGSKCKVATARKRMRTFECLEARRLLALANLWDGPPIGDPPVAANYHDAANWSLGAVANNTPAVRYDAIIDTSVIGLTDHVKVDSSDVTGVATLDLNRKQFFAQGAGDGAAALRRRRRRRRFAAMFGSGGYSSVN